MTDQAATATLNPASRGAMREVLAFFKARLTPRVGATVAIWQFEAKTATPVAVLFVATLGRWEGALAMGALMALYSAILLFLLEGQQIMEDLRDWMRGRGWGKRYLHVAEKQGRSGTAQRVLAVPATIMIYGPFWRAVTYHLARVPRVPAYLMSVGGSIPHSLFWTGLVVGGFYGLVLQPGAQWLWSAAIDPAFSILI